jgi:phage tail protein X
VQRGETLGEICVEAYGTQKGGLPLALARFNGLDDPGQIREGQDLLIPDRARLELPR